MADDLNRPINPRLNSGHPWARDCVGAWFFGPDSTIINDVSGNNAYLYATVGSSPQDWAATGSPWGSAVDLRPSSGATGGYGATKLRDQSFGELYGSADPISLFGAHSALFSIRIKYNATFDQQGIPYIFEKGPSSGSIGEDGYALLYDGDRLKFYADGTEVMRSNIITPEFEVDAWIHIVIVVAFNRAVANEGNEIYLNRQPENAYTSQIPGYPTGIATPVVLFSTPRSRTGGFSWSGPIDHLIVYGRKEADSIYSPEEVKMVFDDPYAPFRATPNYEVLGEIPIGVPGDEFAAHRMHFAL